MNKLIALGIILIICVLFGACSADSDTIENNTNNSSTSDSAAPTEQSSVSEIHFSSLEEYVDYVLSETDKEEFAANYMTYKIYAEQDCLVYDYTYDQQYDNISEIKSKLDAAYNPEDESVKYLLSELRRCIDIDSPKIKYIYRNHNGTVIAEYIYK